MSDALTKLREDIVNTHRVNESYLYGADVQRWLALIDQAIADRAWRPIETAPKDGTTVLVRDANGRVSSAEAGWPGNRWRQATHWMPRPPEPKATDTSPTSGE